MTAVTGPGVSLDRETRIVAAAAGDAAAFASLYQEFAPKVYNLVLRSVRNAHSAEDVCQEVWVRAYQRLDQVREPAAFSTWLYRIASHACIDRSRKPIATPEAELPDQLAASSFDDPEAATIRHEGDRLLWQALAVLPTRQHLALFLREVEGKNYREIAGILGTSESAIETLLFRARRGVADAFERLQSAGERCGQVKKSMAALIDGEANAVQLRAVQAHVDECRACRSELATQRQVSAAYSALPLIPLPALVAGRVLEAATGASIGAGVSGGASGVLSKLLGLATQAKLATVALTVTGGLTIATLALPGDTSRVTTDANAPSQSSAAADASLPSDGASTAPSVAIGVSASLTVPSLGSLPVAPMLSGLVRIMDQVPAVFAGLLSPASGAPPGETSPLAPSAGVPGASGIASVPAVPGVTPPAIVPEVSPPIPLPTVPLDGLPTPPPPPPGVPVP